MPQVTVRGPKDDVEKAKKMLAELANEKQLSSMTCEVRAKPEHHKFLIGRHGSNVQAIRDKTGARIIFPGEKDKDREVITIVGTKDAVAAAKIELENKIKGLVSNILKMTSNFLNAQLMTSSFSLRRSDFHFSGDDFFIRGGWGSDSGSNDKVPCD